MANKETAGTEADSHRQEACRLLSGMNPQPLQAAAEAREASTLDQRWRLFFLAIIDAQDEVMAWFDPGGDERVMNLTCWPRAVEPETTVRIYNDPSNPQQLRP